MLHSEIFKNRIKMTKVYSALEFYQLKWLKPYTEFNTRKRIEAENNGDKDGKAFWKTMFYVVKQRKI